ncbi:MAG: redoxin domain-containing protein [Planctomycetales bacterium]|nr:redoxin domain-containing protein [Planctomycetales bacterium]
MSRSTARYVLIFVFVGLAGLGTASAQQNPDGRLPIGGLDNPLVFLLRDEVVLKDLKATTEQRASLAKLSDKIDALILPTRNQSAEKSQTAWETSTRGAERYAAAILTDSQRQRLEQIKYWIQGSRALVRDEVAERLKLEEKQRQEIREILEETQTKVADLYKRAAAGEQVAPLEEEARELKLAEQRRVLEKMTGEQRTAWAEMVGPAIDISQLGQVTFRAPELISQPTDWLNTTRPVEKLTGRVTAVHFFANGCINCQRNYEHYRKWHTDFSRQGLTIVGIHTPETDAEHDVDRLKKKIAEAGFQFPILVDNEKRNWNAWGNSMWPSVYLVDSAGRIRYWWYGELNWQGQEGEKRLRQRIEELLAEFAP